MKTLKSSFAATVGGGQPAILIRTDEPDEAAAVVSEVAKKWKWHFWVWDFVKGLEIDGKNKAAVKASLASRGNDPLGNAADPESPAAPGGVAGFQQALRAMAAFNNREMKGNEHVGYVAVVLAVKNLPMVAPAVEVKQEIANHLKTFEETNKCIVGFGHSSAELPPEIRPAFTALDHELPGPEDLAKVALSTGGTNDWEPTADEIVEMAEAGLGLTRLQFKNVISSYLFDARLACAEFMDDPDNDPVMSLPMFVWRMKSEILNREKLVTVLDPKFGFDKLGGLQGLKDFHLQLLTNPKLLGNGKNKPKAEASASFIVSGPGMAKTTFISCLAHELQAGAVMMDFGSMLGGHIGDTEKTTRRAFAIVDAIAPQKTTTAYKVTNKDIASYGELITPVMQRLSEGSKVRFLIVGWDEVEKALAGATASGAAANDTGVNKRQFEYVLRWLANRRSRSYVIATANSAAGLDSAFTRAGRFDAVFYIEKPDREQKDAIWQIHIKKFGLERLAPLIVRKGQDFWQTDARKGGVAGTWTRDEAEATTFNDPEDADEVIAACKAKGAYTSPKLPDDTDWTGAEIEDCCKKAYLLDKSLVAAAKMVVPVFKRDKEGQAVLEEWAKGATLSAKTQELYGSEMQSVGAGSGFGTRVKRRVNRSQPVETPDAEQDADTE